jgi:hypothetical protein
MEATTVDRGCAGGAIPRPQLVKGLRLRLRLSPRPRARHLRGPGNPRLRDRGRQRGLRAARHEQDHLAIGSRSAPSRVSTARSPPTNDQNLWITLGG